MECEGLQYHRHQGLEWSVPLGQAEALGFGERPGDICSGFQLEYWCKVFCVSEFPQELVGESGMILLEYGAWQPSFRDTQLGNSQRPVVVGWRALTPTQTLEEFTVLYLQVQGHREWILKQNIQTTSTNWELM